ncbi:UPF0739 protein C1orf74 homolog [Ruditapes philippinarum]|uniref:UPF0739 protein C1orf74 homolog n=1 Tax=Ruditapes philippinarum TaxID=129788 RepID=UPI00295B6CA9|nr:UPF0739 protein C1orf74 homolog [Ruditapes philippinarum]
MDIWKNIIIKHLGRKVARHWDSFMMDILAVDKGIKPAYLYDIGQPNGKQLVEFLKDLKEKEFIMNNLNVIEIEMDCLIVNTDELKQIVPLIGINERLIDVSEYLKEPEICGIGDAAKSIKENLENLIVELDCCKVKFLSGCCLTCNISSLFGVLLNYPVVYWFDSQDGKGGNCLSMERLTNVKVEICCVQRYGQNSKERPKSHCLYSFSYPSCLSIICRPFVDQWFHRLRDRVNEQDLFSNVTIKFEEVILEAVCL